MKSCATSQYGHSQYEKSKESVKIQPQHQSTNLGGKESASIEIAPFRPHFIKIQMYFF